MTDFLTKLDELKAKATPRPWWEWPDMPYLFSGDREQKNAYLHSACVGRFDYGEGNRELIAHLRNHADEIAELVRAATVARDTIPHMGGNKMSTYSLVSDLTKALAALDKEKS